MKKLLVGFFVLLSSVSMVQAGTSNPPGAEGPKGPPSNGRPSVSASFSPSSTYKGVSVLFRWSSSNAVECRVTGVPGLTSNYRTSGSHRFTAQRTLSARVTCLSPRDLATTRVVKLTVSATPPSPRLTISFPSSVIKGAKNRLAVRSSYAKSCTFKYTANSAARNIGTSLTENVIYSNVGRIVQTARCLGLNGKYVQTSKAVSVTTAPVIPRINSFTNTAVHPRTGRTSLRWSTTNASSCTLKYGSTTRNVSVNSSGYSQTIPMGGRRYTLTCKRGSRSVSKNRFVYRDDFPCLKASPMGPPGCPGPKAAGLSGVNTLTTGEQGFVNDLDRQLIADLKEMDIDLMESGVTHLLVDFNGDHYDDIVIHRESDNMLFVLINNNGTFDSISRELNDVDSIKAVSEVHVEDNEVVNVVFNLNTTVIK